MLELNGGLERWPDGEAAVELLGYTTVYAYQWTGNLSGWVDFDGGEQPRREVIEMQATINEDLEYQGSLGRVVIAEQERPGEDGLTDCWVWARMEINYLSDEGNEITESLDREYHGVCKHAAERTRTSMGDVWRASAREVLDRDLDPWLKLRVTPFPKIDRSAEPSDAADSR